MMILAQGVNHSGELKAFDICTDQIEKMPPEADLLLFVKLDTALQVVFRRWQNLNFHPSSRPNSSRTLDQSSASVARFIHSAFLDSSTASCHEGGPKPSRSPAKEHHNFSISSTRWPTSKVEMSMVSFDM